jgi:hypothetical protein
LLSSPESLRLQTYIKYGNQLRETFDDDQTLAAITITRIIQRRANSNRTIGNAGKVPAPEKNVYLLHQFKRREEIDLLRSIYGSAFFQVSVYSRRGARVDYLSRQFAEGQNRGNSNSFRGAAEEIVQKDENESDEKHGQRVSRIFHDADVILNSDKGDDDVKKQISRFCDLLFGSNKISPNKNEYGTTQVFSFNIVQLPTAPFFPTLPAVPPDVQNNFWTYAVDTSTGGTPPQTNGGTLTSSDPMPAA